MANYVFKMFQGLFTFLARNSRFLPASFLGLFLAVSFVGDAVRAGPAVAIANLAKSLFAAELVINENVHLAIINSPEYTIGAFFDIVFAFFVIWFFVKWITKLFVKIAGAQAEWGAMLMALFFVFGIEIAAVKMIDGVWGFIPIKDGIWFLFQNLDVVFTSISL